MGNTAIDATKGQDDEHVIKPQSTTPASNTSDWPLLLKNYDKRTRCPLTVDKINGLAC